MFNKLYEMLINNISISFNKEKDNNILYVNANNTIGFFINYKTTTENNNMHNKNKRNNRHNKRNRNNKKNNMQIVEV